MHRSVLTAAAVVFAVAGFSVSPARAGAPVCAERAILAESLARRYHEMPVSVGLNVDGGMLEVFASKAGTWTILLTDPNGHSCVMTAGDNWESLPPVADTKGKGQKS